MAHPILVLVLLFMDTWSINLVKIGQTWWKSWIWWLLYNQKRAHLAKNTAFTGWNISSSIKFKSQIWLQCTFMVSEPHLSGWNLWLPTTLEGPGAICYFIQDNHYLLYTLNVEKIKIWYKKLNTIYNYYINIFTIIELYHNLVHIMFHMHNA